jgi:hypothetical protein
VDHTLGDRDRDLPDYFESRQVLKEWSLGTTVNVKNGSPKLPALLKKFASKGHAEHLPFQLSPMRGPFHWRCLPSLESYGWLGLFPNYFRKRRGQKKVR